MEAIAVQVQQAVKPQPQQKAPQAKPQQNGEALTLRDILAANAMAEGAPQQAGGQDSFLALMLQQMLGMQDMPMPEDGFAQLKAQLEKDGSELGAQMLMEMLMAGQSVSVADISEMVAQMMGGEATQEAGAVAAVSTNTSELMALITGKPQPVVVQPQAAEQQPVTAQTAVVQEVAGTWKSAEQTGNQENALSGQAAFQQAVAEAQKLIKAEKGTEKETAPIDVDRLQTKVDASKAGVATVSPMPTQEFASAEQIKGAAEPKLPTPEDLMAQVKTGIAAGMNTGKNEFVVKLKPDGLGEITVKMVESGSQISMSIVTSSTQVQRMISSELAGLREAMKPLGVEVAQVTSQEGGHFNAEQQSNFGGHQHQQFKQNHTSDAWYDRFDSSETGDITPEDLAQEQPNNSLNTYI